MNRYNSYISPARTWLLIGLLLYIVLWSLCPQEFIASDPWKYSLRAFEIFQNFDLGDSDVFNHRLAVTLPVAFIYAIFGVNIITTNLWPLCAALLVVLVVWTALPDKKTKLIGAFLCLTSVTLFQASAALFPDIIATALMALSTFILLNRKKFFKTSKIWFLTPLAATFILFLAFLAKESAYWVLPLWFMAFIADFRHSDVDRVTIFSRFYLPVFIIGAFFIVAYLVFCYVNWGDPLARFKSIEALTGHHLWSWDKASSWELIKRLTINPLYLLYIQYGVLTLVLAFFSPFIAPQSIRPWIYYTISCLLFFWFGSTSFTHYEPMPLVPRMTLPLLPGLYILAACTVSRISTFFERKGWIRPSISISLILVLASIPFANYVKYLRSYELAESNAMTIIKSEIIDHPMEKYLLICSDSRSPNSLSFYFGYKYPKNLHVLSVHELNNALLNSTLKSFLFLHRERSMFLESAYGKPHFDEEIESLGLTPIYESWSVKLFMSESKHELDKLILQNNRIENNKG